MKMTIFKGDDSARQFTNTQGRK